VVCDAPLPARCAPLPQHRARRRSTHELCPCGLSAHRRHLLVFSSQRCPAEFPPLVTLSIKLAPFGVRSGDVDAHEGLLERAAPRHVWASDGAGVRDPARQKLAWCPTHGHAGDMASPAEDAAVVVDVERLDLELTEQAVGGDVMANGVRHVDAAHGAAAVVLEAAKAVEEVLAQTPDLAAIEKDRHDKSHVDPKRPWQPEGLLTSYP
jgi:hypothetical protein